jgi:phosphoglycerate dehydrogenase-like enzyme
MLISTFLVSHSAPCWTFEARQAMRLTKTLPACEVKICATESEFVKSLPETEIALVWKFEQDWLDKAPNLKWIATPAAGKDYFFVEPRPGLRMTNGNFHGPLMAETMLGMMLANCRGVIASQRLQNKINWPQNEIAPQMRTLRGSTVTILGFGKIGKWVGKYAKTFGARIIGVNRSSLKRPDYFDESDEVLPLDRLDSALPQTDHLALVLPRSESTDNIIDEERLDRLPSHAYIYNMGRGNAIDEDALYAALSSGKIAGASLDVFKTEPLPDDSPLRKCDNLLIMPHSTAICPQYMDEFAEEFIGMYKQIYA